MTLPNELHPGFFSAGGGADLGDTIEQSLRFKGSTLDFQYTPSTTGDRQTWTWATWIKRSNLSGTHGLLGVSAGASDSQQTEIRIQSTGMLALMGYNTTFRQTAMRFRDPIAWYHIVVVCDITNSTANDRIRFFVNGKKITDWDVINNPGTSDIFAINYADNTRLGLRAGGSDRLNGYLAETYFLDGIAVTDTGGVIDEFGRYNTDGVWVPKRYTGSFGPNNGYHLKYDSSGYNGSGGIGADHSGSGNNFTATNFDTTAISSSNFDNDIDYLDTPTSNYSTLNPLHARFPDSLTRANLATGTSGSWQNVGGTIVVPETGKWYFEYDAATVSTENRVGFQDVDMNQIDGGSGSVTGYWFVSSDGSVQTDGSADTSVTAWSAGDIIGVQFDRDNDEVKVLRNNSLIKTWDISSYTKRIAPFFSSPGANNSVNFGQMNFQYTPPTGFSALQTNNLPEPTIKNGKKHFGIMLYTGDGGGSGAGNVITDTDAVDFTPDMVWIKKRANGSGSTTERDHVVFDTVRGKNSGYYKVWRPSDTNGGNEGSPQHLSNIGNGTITVHDITSGEVNQLNNTFVAWCWKAGGAPTATNTATGSDAPTSGSVMINGEASTTGLSGTIKAKKISANTEAGFSIVHYTGNTTGGATVDHGLTSTPEFIMIKCLTTNPTRPTVLNTAIGTNGDTTFGNAEYSMLYLNSDVAASNNSSDLIFPGNSTTFALGDGVYTNSNQDYIAYVWHSVPNVSKFGAYTGNNNSNGPYIHCGFKPAWVMTKRTDNSSGGEWAIFDSKRNTFNPNNLYLACGGVNGNNNEATFDIDFLSNGFKIRGTGGYPNQSGNYVYACFAEYPFGGENTPPATAR